MSETSVLQRLMRPEPGRGSPADAGLLERAVARAADRAAGLAVAMRGPAAPGARGLAPLLDDLKAMPLLFALERDGVPEGIAALDHGLAAALVEMQALGRLLPGAAPERPLSGTDAALARPLPVALLRELAASEAPAMTGWEAGLEVGTRWREARAAALELPRGDYRLLRLRLDLGTSGREGEIVLARHEPPETSCPQGRDWHTALREAVLPAPARMTAVLARVSLPLDRLEALAPGMLFPLSGADLGAVRLEGTGGAVVARARLGQVSGMRAVRLEAGHEPALAPLPSPAALPKDEG